jgi:PTH1 family peptidyl-tRNA hydrolase
LRFGIGNNYPKGYQADFVLGKRQKVEEPLVKYKISKAVEVIENFAAIGIEAAMNLANNKEFLPGEPGAV